MFSGPVHIDWRDAGHGHHSDSTELLHFEPDNTADRQNPAADYGNLLHGCLLPTNPNGHPWVGRSPQDSCREIWLRSLAYKDRYLTYLLDTALSGCILPSWYEFQGPTSDQ